MLENNCQIINLKKPALIKIDNKLGEDTDSIFHESSFDLDNLSEIILYTQGLTQQLNIEKRTIW